MIPQECKAKVPRSRYEGSLKSELTVVEELLNIRHRRTGKGQSVNDVVRSNHAVCIKCKSGDCVDIAFRQRAGPVGRHGAPNVIEDGSRKRPTVRVELHGRPMATRARVCEECRTALRRSRPIGQTAAIRRDGKIDRSDGAWVGRRADPIWPMCHRTSAADREQHHEQDQITPVQRRPCHPYRCAKTRRRSRDNEVPARARR